MMGQYEKWVNRGQALIRSFARLNQDSEAIASRRQTNRLARHILRLLGARTWMAGGSMAKACSE